MRDRCERAYLLVEEEGRKREKERESTTQPLGGGENHLLQPKKNTHTC